MTGLNDARLDIVVGRDGGQGGKRVAGIYSQRGVGITAPGVEVDIPGGGGDPFPPDGMAPGVVHVLGLVGFLGGVGVIAGDFGRAVGEGDDNRVGKLVVGGHAGRAVEVLRAGDIVRGDGVDVTDPAVHDRGDGLGILIRMVQAEGVAQLVDGDPLEIHEPGAFGAAVGIPGPFGVKGHIGFGALVAEEPGGGDGERGVAESLAENIGGKDDFIDLVVVGRGVHGRTLRQELHVAEQGIPSFSGGLHGAVVIGAINQRLAGAEHDPQSDQTRVPFDRQAGFVVLDIGITPRRRRREQCEQEGKGDFHGVNWHSPGWRGPRPRGPSGKKWPRSWDQPWGFAS